jgi:hypothetical protein
MQLQSTAGGGIVLEQAAAVDVLADLLERAMAGLFHDGAFGSAAFGCRGRETRAEQVSGEDRRIETDLAGQALDDLGQLVVGDRRIGCFPTPPSQRWK